MRPISTIEALETPIFCFSISIDIYIYVSFSLPFLSPSLKGSNSEREGKEREMNLQCNTCVRNVGPVTIIVSYVPFYNASAFPS